MSKILLGLVVATLFLGGGPMAAITDSSGPRNLADARASMSASAADALTSLDLLKVKGRAPRTGYSRAMFGAAWSDVDRNGCDTRNDVLRRDLTETSLKPSGCVVLSGALADPYGGTTLAFVRGAGTSSEVQIDHVVALGDAWVKGAQALPPTVRTALANDPLNLLAVKGSLNSQKRDGDAATWLPPRKAYRCDYVARQIAVKRSYHLWVTAPEKAAMVRLLEKCDGQVLPTRSDVKPPPIPAPSTTAPTPSPSPSPTADPSSTPSPSATDTPTPSTGVDPRFRTCGDAIAAGYGPYRRGVDPEYSWYRDADGDGVVCEK